MDHQQGTPMLDDILHPLSILDWNRTHPWKYTDPKCCAVLKDTLCIVSRKARFGDTLHFCSTRLWEWNTISTQYEFSSLTTYKSKFLSIGGYNRENRTISTEVRVLNEQVKYQSTSIPQMQFERYRVSSVSIKISESEYLVVAGGQDLNRNPSYAVEVLVENQWITVDSLPLQCTSMQCTFHEGYVYFLGSDAILYCKCDMLYSRIMENNLVHIEQLWNFFKPDHAPITLVSYGNRLLSVDERLTIRGYCCMNHSWIETVSRSNEGSIVSNKAATAVINSGELIVAYGNDAVYKISASVSNFYRECNFIRGSISRLEAVMKTDIKSQIAKFHHAKLAELNPNTMRDGRIINAEISPLQFVEEVVFTRNINSSSTWQDFFEVLHEAGLQKLSEKIESFMKGETKYEEACDYFIKHRNCIKMYFLKFIFLGPTGLGKTTTRRRLTGEIVNLKINGEAHLQQPSTAVVERKNIVITSTTSLITKSIWSTEVSLQDEACILLKNLIDALNKTSSDSTNSISSIQSVTPNESYATNTSSRPDILLNQVTMPSQDRSVMSDSLSSFPIQEVPDWFSLLKEAAKISKYWKDIKCQFEFHLRMEDTGGQPELMDLLPSLTVSPGMYLLFVNLQNSLEEYYKVSYTSVSGATITSRNSYYSVKDMIMTELSSIFCLSKVKSSDLLHEEACNSDLKHILESSKSVAYVIGTHKDKVSDEHIMKFDKDLQHILKDTFFYDKDIIQYYSDDRLIFTLDNMKGGLEEISEIRQLLEKGIERHYKKLSIPVSWLLFSISLRLKQKTKTTYDFCLILSEHFKMSEYETKVALWFLHHHAGILMHFPNIPELKNLVILDNQIVPDSVTRIIFETMKSDKVSKAAREKFQKNGEFLLNDILQATAEDLKDCILPHQLIAILEYVHIIAKINFSQDKHFPDESPHETYIMPCVLNNLPIEELDDLSKNAYDQNYISPIAISYECGFIPIGVFPAMIARIVGNQKKYNITKIRNMKKNKIEYFYGNDYDNIVLIYRPSYLEIIINRYRNPTIQAHEVCDKVRLQIESILKEVNSRMNYKGIEDFHLSFVCPDHTKRDHLCKVNKEHSPPSKMLCMKDEKPINMKPKHQIWFKNVQIQQPQSIDDCPTMAYLQAHRWDNSTETKILDIIDKISLKWKVLADHVGLNSVQVNTIEKQHPDSVECCCRGVFEYWLDGKAANYEKTWKSVVEILNLMHEDTLAANLQEMLTASQ